jgi:hypothetical protein
MFAAINKTIGSVVEALQSYLPSNPIVNELNSIYQSIQRIFTRGKTQNDPIPAAPLSTEQLVPVQQGQVTDKVDALLPDLIQADKDEPEIFPTYGRAYFRTNPAVPADERAKFTLSAKYRGALAKFTGSAAVEKHSIALFEKLNSQYLLKYTLRDADTAAKTGRGTVNVSQAEKDLNSLLRPFNRTISALIDEFQPLIDKVGAGKATPAELKTFALFITQQKQLLTELEKALATASKRWEN